jgi:hypothetical protein
MRMPWARLRKVKCKDGRRLNYYHNIDDALPLYISDTSLSRKLSADVNELASVEGTTSYSQEMKAALFRIGEDNESLIIRFRGIYLLYQGNPCDYYDRFASKVEEIVSQSNELTARRLRVRQLIELAQVLPAHHEELANTFAQMANDFPESTVIQSRLAELAIKQSRADGNEWRHPKHGIRRGEGE